MDPRRRRLLQGLAGLPAALSSREARPGVVTRLFLCGDVMTGRGIDQLLSHPGNPALREPFVRSARTYLRLAQERSGPIVMPVPDDYVWGEALARLERERPAARIVNLETAITAGGRPEVDKGIHYRMHPDNTGCLTAAALDLCVLANNHVLDWGEEGLLDTLAVLRRAGIATAGAGADLEEASAPALLATRAGRLLVYALGFPDSGIPYRWAAGPSGPGLWLAIDADQALDRLRRSIAAQRRPGDRVILSLHWGPNWGYRVARQHRDFAHAAIGAGVDLIHGHSSHHPVGMEVWRGRLVLYGCGDFINDYEGIAGHEQYRPWLRLMYLPELAADGSLLALRMFPFRSRRLRLEAAGPGEAHWLARRLDTACAALGGARVTVRGDQLRLQW